MAVYIKREPVVALEELSYAELDRIIQRNYEAIVEMVVEARVLEEHGIFLEAEVVKAKKEGLISRFRAAIDAIVAKLTKGGKDADKKTEVVSEDTAAKLHQTLIALRYKVDNSGGIKNFSFNGPDDGHLIDYKNKYYSNRAGMPTSVTGVEKYVDKKNEWQKRIDADNAKFTKAMLGVENIKDANPEDCMELQRITTAKDAYEYVGNAYADLDAAYNKHTFFYKDCQIVKASINSEAQNMMKVMRTGEYGDADKIIPLILDYYNGVTNQFRAVTIFKQDALEKAYQIILKDGIRIAGKIKEK